MAGERVLVIEDKPEMVQILTDYVLGPQGYVTLAASNGEEGLRMALSEEPDLVILDLRMPKMSGLQVLQTLREQQYSVPVIVITAYGSEEVVVHALRLGADDYIAKPFELDEMIHAIERVLGKSKAEKAPGDQVAHTRQAIERRDNPYVANVPVSDPKMFFGRQEILNQIVNGIHLNNFAVCGPKRIGKTSLLHRLAAELCQMDDVPCSFFPVLLSLHGIPENRLFRTLMSAIVREYRSQTAPLALRCRAEGESYDTYNFLDDLDAVQETLQRSVNKPLRLVLLIDEGDTLNEYSQATLAQLRFVFMGPALNYLKMVWSGEDLDKREWKLRGSDWLTVFGHVFHLTPFTEEEAIRLIVEPVPYYRYDKQAVRLILDHSQLIPHRIQLLCRGAVEEMLKARRGWITVEDVEASIRHLTGETAPPGIQPLTISALAADSREQPAHRLAEGDAEYHTDMENEEAE